MGSTSGSAPAKRTPWKIALRVLFLIGAAYLAFRRWTQWQHGDSTAILSVVLWGLVAASQLVLMILPDLLSNPDKPE